MDEPDITTFYLKTQKKIKQEYHQQKMYLGTLMPQNNFRLQQNSSLAQLG